MYPRRRFLTIAATVGAACAVPHWAWAHQRTPISDWRGYALGAPASMRLAHPDQTEAKQTIQACIQEIARLEQIFSLYDPHSALSRLNATGQLQQPPFELLEVLSFALRLAHYSQGHFDPTIQPLYELYARHFATPQAAASGPSAQAIRKARAKVDYRQLEINLQEIRLLQPGMAISLNGIAQGYITDKIAQLLTRKGFQDILIDVGEIRAHGQRPDGSPWTASLANLHNKGQSLLSMHLGEPQPAHSDNPVYGPALATSAGLGSPFVAPLSDNVGTLPQHHHLLNPHTGQSAQHYLSVSVAAKNAMVADGLSTALSMMAPEQGLALIAHWPSTHVWLLPTQGELITLSA